MKNDAYVFEKWAIGKMNSKERCLLNKAQRCYPTFTDEECWACYNEDKDES